MRDKIKLVSSEGTGHYYTTTKNKRTMPEKLEIKKFDPVVRKHVIYKEAKIKQRLGKRTTKFYHRMDVLPTQEAHPIFTCRR